jgi:gluconate 5-dehydrogenase
MNEKAMSERASGVSEMEQRFQAAVPMGRIGGADDIKAAAVFMASPGSKYMTGQEVVVDGGWSAW